jgi:predicted site-specific integrase-resolvase
MNLYQGCAMSQTTARRGLGDYLTVKGAAALLGVCPGTLRNWDRAGKLKPARHPMNGYRLYRRSDLEAVLAAADAGPGLTAERTRR